ncbi:hypothetical protein NPIL_91611 [Nephila pilipes]|uniref:Uncharacterized protein n=1 Tax=Nephila pilipes TaxID=299642 RepID=A0A8X6TN08_NEPPI|nr:hypothetical protein NPIL_91611 [Nephila pilipes]
MEELFLSSETIITYTLLPSREEFLPVIDGFSENRQYGQMAIPQKFPLGKISARSRPNVRKTKISSSPQKNQHPGLIVIRHDVSSVNYFISPNHFRTLIGLGCIKGCTPTIISTGVGGKQTDSRGCGRTFPQALLVNLESLPSRNADCNPSYIFIHIDEY